MLSCDMHLFEENKVMQNRKQICPKLLLLNLVTVFCHFFFFLVVFWDIDSLKLLTKTSLHYYGYEYIWNKTVVMV